MTKVSDLHRKWMKNEEYRNAHEALAPDSALARSVIDAPVTAGLTQKQLDQRMDTTQSDIARLEKSASKLSAQQGADQQRVAELQQRIAALNGQMGKQASALDALEGSGLGDADVDLRRKQLEKQRDDLAREYELLMKMQVELVQ